MCLPNPLTFLWTESNLKMWQTPLLLSGSLWPSWLVGAGQGAFSPFSHQQLSIMIAAVRGSPIEIVIAIFSLDSEGWWLWFTAKQRRLRRETPANPFFSPNYPQKVQHHHRNGLAHQSRVWTFGRMTAILFKRGKNYPPPLTLLDPGGGRFAPTITYSRIRGCVCIYRC